MFTKEDFRDGFTAAILFGGPIGVIAIAVAFFLQ